MRASLTGGAPLTVVGAVRSAAVGTRRTEQGGAWSHSGEIVYAAGHGEPSLSRVSANGGAVSAATLFVKE